MIGPDVELISVKERESEDKIRVRVPQVSPNEQGLPKRVYTSGRSSYFSSTIAR